LYNIISLSASDKADAATPSLWHPCMFGHRLTTIPSFLKHAAYTIKFSRRSYTQPSSPIELQKQFSRRGRNLSERFRRLEKRLSGKHNLTDASPPLAPALPHTPQKRSTVRTFRGLVIPEVPKAPEPDGVHPRHCVGPLFSHSHRMLYVWLCSMRARFIPRISRRLQFLRGGGPRLPCRYESTCGRVAGDHSSRLGEANASSSI
jgi:hypothetical protein